MEVSKMRRLMFLLLCLLLLGSFALIGCDDDDDDDDNTPADDDDTADDDDDNDNDSDPGLCGDPVKNLYAEYCPDSQDPCASEGYVYNFDEDDEGSAIAPGFETGDIEAKLFRIEAPFHVETIKLKFKTGGGTARIHLYGDMLGSVPQVTPWTDMVETVEFTEPIDVEVPESGWLNVDVSDRNLMFEPGTKVWVGFEHLSDDGLPELFYSGIEDPYLHSRYYRPSFFGSTGFRWGWAGTPFGNYRHYMIRLLGNSFCQMEDPPYFTDATDVAGLEIAGQGQHRTGWADVDGDGMQDIIFTRLSQTDPATVVYYHNNGDGTFTDKSSDSGLDQAMYAAMSAFVDYDNDGDQDLFALVQVAPDPGDDDDDTTDGSADGAKADHGYRNQLLKNDGSGNFTLVTETTGLELPVGFSSAGFGDLDRDGQLDLYIGAWLLEYPYSPSFPDRLFLSNGDDTFEDISEASGIWDEEAAPCYGVTWVDFNDDGWYDIFVSNYGRVNNFLWENNGNGTFTNVAKSVGLNRPKAPFSSAGNTFGADFGDWNNDGYFDAFMSDIAHPRYQPGSGQSSINLNDGPPDFDFTWMNEELGYHTDEGDVGPSFVDFNNDGRLDLYISSLYGGHFSRLYEQQADGTMLDATYWAGVETHDSTGNAWGDYDGDGDMDLLSAFRANGGGVTVFRNDGDYGNKWVEFKLVGETSNRDAIGAKVTVTAGDLVQHRYVQGPRGQYSAMPMKVQHFGLGAEAVIDTVEVRWPTGETETWTGLDAEAIYVLTEGDPTPTLLK
jgi:enediyne biosynthesis protein E4